MLLVAITGVLVSTSTSLLRPFCASSLRALLALPSMDEDDVARKRTSTQRRCWRTSYPQNVDEGDSSLTPFRYSASRSKRMRRSIQCML